MPTLIERLRLGTNMHDRACHLAMHEAATEIERLRAALTHIMELGYHSLDPDVDKRMTELAREAVFEDCPNRRGLTEDEALIEAIEGPEAVRPRPSIEEGAWPALTNAADD
jgi:hypothetical protein